MTLRTLGQTDRDRLRAVLSGRTLVQVKALFPDISADTAARAACGMPINAASQRVIVQRLAELQAELAVRP
jgi:hypothetical protein